MNIPDTPQLIPFICLALAICAAWIPPVLIVERFRLALSPALLVSAIVSGALVGVLKWQAILMLAVLCGMAYVVVFFRLHRLWRRLLMVLIGVMALAMSLYHFPGFNKLLLIPGAQFSVDAPLFVLYANFDKAAAGLILLTLFGKPVHQFSAWKQILSRTIWYAAIVIICVLGLAVVIGYVKPDYKWSPYSGVFLISNLLFTCVAEEAFFRTCIQRPLAQMLSSWRYGAYLTILLAALLFGIAHLAGGPVLAGLVMLAGIGYGYAFHATGKIEVPILVHFLLNATHFIAFTYPNLIH